MPRFLLFVVIVLAAVGIGIGALGLSSRTSTRFSIVPTDTAGTPLPGALVALADKVIFAAQQHDARALGRLVDAGDPTDPGVLEQNELLAMPGAFETVVTLLTRTRAYSSPDSEGYIWRGPAPGPSRASPTQSRGPSYDGIQMTFFHVNSWAFFGIAEAASGTGLASKPYGGFVGGWFGHDRAMWINPDGSFTLTARSFVDCGAKVEAGCDRFVGNEIIDGANATGRVTAVVHGTAYGVVTFSTSPDWPKGSIKLSFHPATDTVTLSSGELFCGPGSPAAYCGA